MTNPPGFSRIKAGIIEAARLVPQGRVTTFDAIAAYVGAPVALVTKLIADLTPDEREFAAWHRVVAKGGAIGWGPHRDAHFAKLIREGVPVSPAGIVQDMPALTVAAFDEETVRESARKAAAEAVKPPGGRSRGMKDRP